MEQTKSRGRHVFQTIPAPAMKTSFPFIQRDMDQAETWWGQGKENDDSMQIMSCPNHHLFIPGDFHFP